MINLANEELGGDDTNAYDDNLNQLSAALAAVCDAFDECDGPCTSLFNIVLALGDANVLDFEATKVPDEFKVELDWMIGSENEIDFYMVERSIDGGSF